MIMCAHTNECVVWLVTQEDTSDNLAFPVSHVWQPTVLRQHQESKALFNLLQGTHSLGDAHKAVDHRAACEHLYIPGVCLDSDQQDSHLTLAAAAVFMTC